MAAIVGVASFDIGNQGVATGLTLYKPAVLKPMCPGSPDALSGQDILHSVKDHLGYQPRVQAGEDFIDLMDADETNIKRIAKHPMDTIPRDAITAS